MKRIVTYLACFSLLAITTSSCSKEEHNEITQQAQVPQVINANVAAGQTYVLNMGAESTVSIKTQALHHQLSEISTALDGSTVYKYAPAKGYTGADEVTLQQTITSTSGGGGGCYNGNQTNGHTTTTVKTIAIKFNVAN